MGKCRHCPYLAQKTKTRACQSANQGRVTIESNFQWHWFENYKTLIIDPKTITKKTPIGKVIPWNKNTQCLNLWSRQLRGMKASLSIMSLSRFRGFENKEESPSELVLIMWMVLSPTDTGELPGWNVQNNKKNKQLVAVSRHQWTSSHWWISWRVEMS